MLKHSLWALLTIWASLSTQAAVRINEIHYDPAIKTELVEFIELYNDGNTALSLAGWSLTDAVEYTFPAGATIPAGGYAVICQNPTHFSAKYARTALGPWLGSLKNEGDEIVLRDATGVVVDRVDYQLGFPWPTVGELPGFSIELTNPAFDNDLGGNWRPSGVIVAGNNLIPAGSTWKYFKGQSEPSAQTGAWRALNFDDSTWLSGRMPIGYDPSVPINTRLNDMLNNYTTVYFRKTFTVQSPTEFESIQLRMLYDDGFKVWINGKLVANQLLPTNEVSYTTLATGTRESANYDTLILSSPTNYLVAGTNIIVVQGANVSLTNSTDFYIDLALVGQPFGSGRPIVPSPFARNNNFDTNIPPALRQVDHSPKQPRAGQPVVISVKATDPEGIASVQLHYQLVNPGNYISTNDAAFATSWTTVPMNDTGTNGDEFVGDSVFSVTMPGTLQTHRRLIRYRITATDNTGRSITAPYADDPGLNFAYFCYDGLPGWTGAIAPTSSNPALSAPVSYSPESLSRIPVYHLISKKTDVETSTWTERYTGDLYKWEGALVYDGKVYDHIHYRARGGVWRYAMGKNMWKLDFNRGHDFEARDNWGREYKVPWTKLNLGACIQQGNYLHRGEQGMFESVGFRLFNLTGLEAPKSHFIHFRIIDDAAESTASQYTNDFWGLYLAIQQEDSRFLQDHDMPDSNLYKMEGGTGELNNLGQFGPADKSDLNAFLSGLTTGNEAWFRANLDLARYYNYRTIVEGIHHYDIDEGPSKNYFYFHNDVSGKWEVHPWDLDLTWADNMYGGGNEQFKNRVLPIPNLGREYKNRAREIRDLLFNTDQAYKLIDEYAAMIYTNSGPSMVAADRAMWDYNPIMTSGFVNSSKAGAGLFYQQAVTKDFPGMVQIMKNYIVSRGNLLDSQATDTGLPNRPTITNLSPAGNPANKLAFRSSAYQGSSSFAAMQWRIGEITPANAPVFDPNNPRKYEIEPVWQSEEIPVFNDTISIPSGYARVGRTYRARVKFKDAIGRWSNWSAPAEFIAGEADNATALVENLRISEVMYNPPLGSDYEFVELFNASTNLTLDLGGAKFTAGIDYTFPTNATLAPQSYCLVMRAASANTFLAHYGLTPDVKVFGPYSGSLNNDGEELVLKTAAAGSVIASFTYGNGAAWPVAADEAGHSLVPLYWNLRQDDNDFSYPGNWRASAYIKGSPGRVDPAVPAPTLILNEVMAHTDFNDPAFPGYDSNDWIELLNIGSASVGYNGWYLSDDPGDLKKWALPPGQNLAASARVVFDEVHNFHTPITSGFGLDKLGETVLLSFHGSVGQERVVDAVKFRGQPNTNSLSRVPDGSGPWRATLPTQNAPNGAALRSLVITEVMYHPATNANETIDNTLDEFVEIHNPTPASVALRDVTTTWRIDGGISYQFPPNTTLAAGEFILLVNFDPATSTNTTPFKTKYSVPANVRLFGPYSGKLGNSSDRIAIERPEEPDLAGEAISWIVVDEVTYGKRPLWPTAPDGAGPSLHRGSLTSFGNDPNSWASAPASAGRIASENPDRDGDGLPNTWETDNGLNPDFAGDAALDKDFDGLSNLAEFQLGTNPSDPESSLRLLDPRVQTGIPTFRIYLVAGKSYVLERCADLNTRQWSTAREVSNVSNSTWTDITDPQPPAGQSQYYRMRLVQP